MSSSKPTFWVWLMRQRQRDDPTGDVARDAKQDQANIPQPKTVQNFRRHLEIRGACDEAVQAFDEAVKEWQSLK